MCSPVVSPRCAKTSIHCYPFVMEVPGENVPVLRSSSHPGGWSGLQKMVRPHRLVKRLPRVINPDEAV